MSEYDILKGLSELDEDLIMQPRKFVSLRMNLLFCFVAANISALVPYSKPGVGIIVFFVSFFVMYFSSTWIINRKKNRKLLIENQNEEKNI